MRHWNVVCAALLVIAASSVQAQTVYSAFDSGAGPGDPHPNSDAAAALFDAAAAGLGTINKIDFESAAVGSFVSLNAAPGVTVTGHDIFGNNLFVNNVPNFPTGPALDGFNTTPGGANYLELTGGMATFTFANPIQAFGAYFTGIQPGFVQDTINFDDGSSQSIDMPQLDAFGGGVTFAGFTDAGKTITSVTIFAGSSAGDFIGIDDVRYGPVANAVPELGSGMMLCGLCLPGLLLLRRRFSR